jgi:small-conductance mechanosensitive channel
MGTGSWVSGDLYNGRIVRIPNSAVPERSACNYSQGFPFIWDEIKVVFTPTSDCQLAREMLLRAAQEAIGEDPVEATSSKAMSDYYRSDNAPLEPTVAPVVNAGSLEFAVSYAIDYTKRTAMKAQLFTKIVEAVTNSHGRLEWTSAAVTVVHKPATPGAIETHPSSLIHGAGHAGDSHS